jgi:TIR domain
MPQDVFISYAKADAKKAARIAELLEERGVRCWIAPRDVKPGASYGDEIIRGIETSSAFILVLSSASNESDFVAREVERAIGKKKAVLPVRIENVEPSCALQLFISGTQWVDAFSGRLATHMDRLAARFAEASPEPEVAMPPATVRSSSCWMWGAGAAAAAAIAILLARPSNRPAQTTDQAPPADPWVISNPVKIQEPTDQVADKPSDPNLGTAETAPADVPAYADRAEPWDNPPAAGAQPAAPAEALPAPSIALTCW